MASYYSPVKTYQGPVQQGSNSDYFKKTGVSIGNTPEYMKQDAYAQTQDMIRRGEIATPTYNGGYLAYENTGSGLKPTSTPTPKNYNVTIPSGGYDSTSLLKNAGIDPSKKKSLFKQYGVSNTPDLLKALQKSAKSRQSDYEKRVRGTIETGFNDVFTQLDQMIGLLPSQKAELEARVNEMAQSQISDVDLEKERGLASLLSSEQKQRQLATSSLRDLEDDVRNSMTAAGRYIGAAGAGDSSATYLASEALAKQAQKGRAGVLNTRDQAINEIELKKADVNSLAMQEKNKVDQWKSSSLMSVAQTFQQRMEALMGEKVNATKERANAITNLIADSYKNFMNELANLDNQALQYAQQIDMWQMQREGELEDYATKLGISASYKGADASAYTDRVSQLRGQGFTLEAANQIAEQEGLHGTYLSPDMFISEQAPSDMTAPGTYIYQDMPWVQDQTPPSNFDWNQTGLS